MREEPQAVVRLGKAIDNSQVVREVDPRSSRDLFWLMLLVTVLVGGLVLYAWPHLQLRQTGEEIEQMSRERERLVEQNRKLRLEKASLENLRRIEAIATRDLGLEAPAPERVVVVESAPAMPEGARLARGGDEAEAAAAPPVVGPAGAPASAPGPPTTAEPN
jgi:cell division protein FtsL